MMTSPQAPPGPPWAPLRRARAVDPLLLLAISSWAVVALVVAEVVRVRRDQAASWRRAREETRRRQAGEERLRIAQGLHDVVAHHMSLINVQASVALHLAAKGSQPGEIDEQEYERRLATLKRLGS